MELVKSLLPLHIVQEKLTYLNVLFINKTQFEGPINPQQKIAICHLAMGTEQELELGYLVLVTSTAQFS